MNKTIYSSDYKEMLERLVEARQKAKLMQADVAKLLGKTQSYVSKVEAGQLRIDVIQLKDFANIYKKPLNYFVK